MVEIHRLQLLQHCAAAVCFYSHIHRRIVTKALYFIMHYHHALSQGPNRDNLMLLPLEPITLSFSSLVLRVLNDVQNSVIS